MHSVKEGLAARMPVSTMDQPGIDADVLWKIFQYSNDAIFILAPEENAVLEVNPAGVRMFGYQSREELLATPLSV
jgi:PAS domain-containing protein